MIRKQTPQASGCLLYVKQLRPRRGVNSKDFQGCTGLSWMLIQGVESVKLRRRQTLPYQSSYRMDSPLYFFSFKGGWLGGPAMVCLPICFLQWQILVLSAGLPSGAHSSDNFSSPGGERGNVAIGLLEWNFHLNFPCLPLACSDCVCLWAEKFGNKCNIGCAGPWTLLSGTWYCCAFP